MEAHSKRRLLLAGALFLLVPVGYGLHSMRQTSSASGRSAALIVESIAEDSPAAATAAPPDGHTHASQAVVRPSASLSSELPPPGTPLAHSYAALKQRADGGDAAAASRLYHDVQRCRAARVAERVIASISRQLPDPSAEAAVVQARAHDSQEQWLSELRAIVNRSAGRCAGATSAQLDSLVPVMARAAQLGDTGAIDCYAGGGFAMMSGLLDHPEWLTDMKENIPRMFDYAVRQGDWTAVELMHHAYAGVFPDTPAGQAIRPDPVMDYRYLRLERLGASGAFVQKLDRMLADAGDALTPQQIAEGDAWANETYAHYFGGSTSNEVSNGANICGNMDD